MIRILLSYYIYALIHESLNVYILFHPKIEAVSYFILVSKLVLEMLIVVAAYIFYKRLLINCFFIGQFKYVSIYVNFVKFLVGLPKSGK